MHVTQGAFSYLPALSDDEIRAQVRYALGHGWVVSIQLTDDPRPRHVYWEMWGLPLFDARGPDDVAREIDRCRQAFPDHYVRVDALGAGVGHQTTMLSFLVQRPAGA